MLRTYAKVGASAIAATLALLSVPSVMGGAAAVAGRPAIHAPSTSMADVSCVSTTFCLAIADGDFYPPRYTIYRHSGWSRLKQMPDGLSAVSCTSATRCIAVGGRFASRFDGTVWSNRRAVVPAGDTLIDISCVGGSLCRAVGGDASGAVFATADTGGSWGAPRRIMPTFEGTADISCVAGGFCAATNGGSLIAKRVNGTWTHVRPATVYELTDVSCASKNFCLATDYNGSVVKYNGARWATQTFRNSPYFTTASCVVATTFCVAGGDNGVRPQARVLNGTQWSTAWTVALPGGNQFSSLSCPTKSFCGATVDHVTHA